MVDVRRWNKFPGNNWRYVLSIYEGVLSLFVKFSSKKIKFVKFHAFGKKKQENMKD